MIKSQNLLDSFIEKANHDLDFGFPSYVLKRGGKYERFNIDDGQYYFDASKKKATRYREQEALASLTHHKKRFIDIEVEIIDDPETRATNAFWRCMSNYRVVQIRMEGVSENPKNNNFFGLTPSERVVELFPEIIDQGMIEIFWCNTQESPWRLYGYAKDFQLC